MLAHICREDGRMQSLEAHCRTVSRLCGQTAMALNLSETAQLLGLLHDMGKATCAFETYLLASAEGEEALARHNHAPTGAIFVYRRWFSGEEKKVRRLTAQLLSLCIYGHHMGLINCLNDKGDSDFLKSMHQDTLPLHYEEATNWFFANIASEEELDSRFQKASSEVLAFWKAHVKGEKREAFYQGALARLLLSILVDADRWDAACFEWGNDPMEDDEAPSWDNLLTTFEAFRERNLSSQSAINEIRGHISNICFEKAALPPGIFTLSVPTGGGKTYSSLRFALRHAALQGQERIFYIIPYNTILDQNARDIREALSPFSSILEHHSNVVQETKEAQKNYRLLTERWDSPIILTSLVQFLNAFFAAPNTDARRLHRLANAVLIFDEIQSLPKHCKTLFECAIEFLTRCCHCTVVLCTATQPKLELTAAPVELMENTQTLFRSMQRVEYVPQLEAMDNEQASRRLSTMAQESSVLAVVNTKAAARDIFTKTTELLQVSGMEIIEAEGTVSDEEILRRAKRSTEKDILCIHLSTLLCPAHRLRLIQWMKVWLKEGKRVLCVSTALIEAGINISFPVVVRSLAGLPSVVQAAGRANRNMEYGLGKVYLWILSQEKLKYLPDIQNGQNISREILAQKRENSPDMPEEMALFFKKEQNYIEKRKEYPSKKYRGTLTDMLSKNTEGDRDTGGFETEEKKLVLKQSFRNAYEEFEAIPDKTVSVLVPFEEGARLIACLNGKHTMEEERFLLRKAQAYSVGVYKDTTFQALKEENALYLVGNCGVWALEEGYYDAQTGVTVEKGELFAEFI